ncbi:MAG: TCR/Tet family MFS transporter [Parasphingopyxis sp.]|uniref:TCR/Tet family MFS transporter n=1 Tax=Parasphingopyxis sp. TaxID=1920299 RepID=UPI0032EFF582
MHFSHRAIPIALCALLLDTIGFGIVIPVLPQLIVELGDVTFAEATRIAGYMLVVFALTQFFAAPVMGRLGDRFGRRPVLLASLTAFTIDYALMAAAPTIAWLFLGRAIAGIAGATYGPVGSLIADLTPPEKRGETFGYMGAAFGLGFIIGPALGGLLGEFGPRVPFYAVVVLGMLNVLAIAFLLPESLAPENRRPFKWREANVLGSFKPLAAHRIAFPLLAAWFLWQFAHQIYPASWAFWAKLQYGWTEGIIGATLAVSGLSMAFVQVFLTGRFIRRIGEQRTIVWGLASGAIGFAAYAFGPPGWMVFAIIVAVALQGLVFPSMNAVLTQLVGPSEQGALQGGVAAMGSLAAILGPLILTQTLASGAEAGFPGASWALAAVLAFAALAIVWFVVLRQVPEEPDIAPAPD